MIELLPLGDLIVMVVIALGLSLVITCTKVAMPLRLAWCGIFRWKYTRWLWNIFTCPHCNAWWSGLAVAILAGYHWLHHGLQVAIVSCGVMYLLQTFKNRDEVIVKADGSRVEVLTAHIECPDDFEEFFDGQRPQVDDGQRPQSESPQVGTEGSDE